MRRHVLTAVVLVTIAAAGALGAGPELRQAEPPDAELQAASAGRTVRVGTPNGRARARVVELPLEIYVARVLAGEGEARAADAAQQALAVAIRTYVAANASRHRRDGYDVCDTTHCQVLRAATPASRRAALATAGQVLMHGQAPAEVFYSASCGGQSEVPSRVWRGAIDHPYLRSQPDEVCTDDEPWAVTLGLRDVETALRRAGFAGRLRNLRVDSRTDSGRVTRLRADGMRPDRVAGEDFRAAVGQRQLRSTAFDVSRRGAQVRFTGRGYGHGVGLCVVGAGRRAARGSSAGEILAQYFPGARVAPGAAAPTAAPASAGAGAAVVAPSGVTVRVPPGAAITREALESMVMRARTELAAALGTSPPAITIDLHATLDSFRQATGRPWWTSVVVNGAAIDLAPAALLTAREGVEAAIRRAVAQVLVAEALADRPEWVRTGAARFFGRRPGERPLPSRRGRPRCPADAELLMAVSAPAQRDAETRAEACFARELAATGDWRHVR